jgi:hypothetical protein
MSGGAPSSHRRSIDSRLLDSTVDSGGDSVDGGGGRPRTGQVSTRGPLLKGTTHTRQPSNGGLNNVRLTTPASARNQGGLASTRTLNSVNGGHGLKTSNVQLALDPLMPETLVTTRSVWRWVVVNCCILAIYAAAFFFAGYSLPTPEWSNQHDKFTIIGWLFHLLGAICYLLTFVALCVKKGPFFPSQWRDADKAEEHKRGCIEHIHAALICVCSAAVWLSLSLRPSSSVILIGYLLALLLFIVGSVLHTTNLGLSAEYASLRSANPDAVLSDVGSASIVDAISAGGSKAALSIQLQWIAALVFYGYASVLVWKAPASSSNIASPSQVRLGGRAE